MSKQVSGGRAVAQWASRVAAAVAGVLASGAAFALAYTDKHYNMPVGVTELSREIHGLHMLIFWICCAIAVVVFGVMFYSVFAHRRSRHPKPADFHESTTVEIIWTVIPFLILISMAVPAAGTLIKMEDLRKSDMTVKVTGYQWKWHYEYVDEGVSFFSTLHPDSNRARQLNSGIRPESVPNYLVDVDQPLVLPVGKKIRFVITANDVIHAWWVPDLAVKKDAIPGFVNEMWAKIDEPGTFRGVCAELCGRDHGYMPIVVIAKPEAEYQQWLADRKAGKPVVVAAATAPTATDAAPAAAPAAPEVAAAPVAAPAPARDSSKDELMASGEKVYKQQCAACHQAAGTGLPPNFPSLVGSPVAAGPADAHVQQTIKGKNLMPPFGHLSDADIAAVVTYERNSWGNKGGVVQPSQVAAQRGK